MEPVRLINSDCLGELRKMSDKSIDLILTDPPYGIGEAAGKNASRNQLARATDYGNLDWDDAPPSAEYFSEMIRVSKNQIIFGGNYFAHLLPPSSCWIVWDKDNSGDFADCELAWTSFPSAVRKVKYRWNGMLQEDMKNKEKRFHPTQKPLHVIRWIIEKYSEPGMTICDPFLGSGTTAVACLETGRRCVGIERETDYCTIAQARLDGAQLSLLVA